MIFKNIFIKIYDYLHNIINHKKDNKTYNISRCLSLQNNKKNDIIDWLLSFNHTHFLTIQFPNNMKTEDSNISQDYLRRLMAKFEYCLIGRYWNKKHLPFIAFSEKGKSSSWHYHLLINSDKYTTNQLQTALDEAVNKLNLPTELINLQEIINPEKLYTYCLKEMKFYQNNRIDTNRIISSTILFGIENKTSPKAQ